MSYAIVAAAAGGPEVLELVETDVPEPGPGQLLVKVTAAGVNFIETYQRSGVYPVNFPLTPGSESAGEVVSVGPAVTDFSIGDRVATAEGAASYAEYTIVDADKALPVPDGVSDQVAADRRTVGHRHGRLADRSVPAGLGRLERPFPRYRP